jgi:hypothetical protein
VPPRPRTPRLNLLDLPALSRDLCGRAFSDRTVLRGFPEVLTA